MLTYVVVNAMDRFTERCHSPKDYFKRPEANCGQSYNSRVVLTRNLPILVLIYKLANWSELERRRNLPKRIQRRFSQKSLIASCTLSIKNAGLLWINFYPKAWRKHYAVSSYYEKSTFSWFDKISVAWVDHSQCRFESCPELDKFMIQKWGFRIE